MYDINALVDLQMGVISKDTFKNTSCCCGNTMEEILLELQMEQVKRGKRRENQEKTQKYITKMLMSDDMGFC